MTQAEALYKLQEIELHLLQTGRRLTEIAAALSDQSALQQAQSNHDSALKVLTPLQTRARNLELEIQSNSDKIKLADEHLYSGRVRNPKEMQDIQQEIEALKKRNQQLEDQLLDTMLQVESAEQSVAESKAHLSSVEESWKAQHRDLLLEQERFTQERASLQQKRTQALADVSADSLRVYTAMKPRKNNQPVALLVEQSCSACRVEQDLAVVSEARRGDRLTTCANCGRILVYRSG